MALVTTLDPPSARPYLLRALYEWAMDQGHTPHVVVAVDASVQVPREYVQDGQIVLNIGPEATSGLSLGNDWICFKARFGGVPRDIRFPPTRVMAFFSRETGEGLGFAVYDAEPEAGDETNAPAGRAASDVAAPPAMQLIPGQASDEGDEKGPPPPPAGPRPALRRIK